MAIVTDKSLPWRVWCHLCDVGFESIAESQQHDKDNLNKHQMIDAKRREEKKNE